ncbi:OPT oligopeptide transporter [Coniophora puteana RWD-64-598 SS2]|uniref:OPT oligopeptide transporter n=1 Tax=Coniophora puteana (strain RWD-64-598) TaxID=741705 RepID=A0A5M3MEL1_CONPW|nr:OPT oligopeptide transporter [Coniophora puteana RWD-64-598 SS2]EIW77662.1 OPT oligopeptide transporter [Coniophora puteana RWD-64-598 SS2]
MSAPLMHPEERDSPSTDLEKVAPREDEAAHAVDALVAEFDDPNIDRDQAVVGVLEDDSPYPEVRSAVANTDDPEMACSTLRAWVMGIVWAVIISGLNQFFHFRYPSVSISSLAAQLLSFPVGRLWARFMPNVHIFGHPLNPGPFAIKEHVLITIMATVGGPSAYATDIPAVQRFYYNQNYNFGYQWMMVMSTQLIGFSFGGILRRFLVSPPSMIWPVNLVTCALFNTLHSQTYAGIGERGGLSRGRFFFYAWLGSLCWYFFPGYLFQALSYFTWVCWIAPDNIVVNQLFGYKSGLGMSLITFDWSQITYIGSPLAAPWWAEANIFAGFVFFFWILTPALYYTNTWYSKYMPISSRTSYDNTGKEYNITRILTSHATLNLTAYQEYSPLFLSSTFALSYGLLFASMTATVTHAILFFRKQIWSQARRSLDQQPDIHARLMARYKPVPEWWYGAIFMAMFVMGVLTIELWPTEMPVWAFLLSLLISFVYVVPVGMIQAITNQQIGLNVITEFIGGYAIPGRPIAVMLFKTWGYITMFQALAFTADFKLGHYMKIPPRSMFWGQIVATAVAATTQLGVQVWVFNNIPDVCTPKQANGFICPGIEVFGTASFIWGVIGPQRQFAAGQLYHALTYFFILGAGLPVVAWLISRRWPNSFIRYVNFPLIFAGVGYIPPASALNYVPWAIVGFIFQFVIRRCYFSWWTKYNYVLSAALDSGVAISIIFIFFCLQYPANGAIGNHNVAKWWGNKVFLNTADGKNKPFLPLPESGSFGPASW